MLERLRGGDPNAAAIRKHRTRKRIATKVYDGLPWIRYVMFRTWGSLANKLVKTDSIHCWISLDGIVTVCISRSTRVWCGRECFATRPGMSSGIWVQFVLTNIFCGGCDTL